jgi:multidrug efflux system outer membrane protein
VRGSIQRAVQGSPLRASAVAGFVALAAGGCLVGRDYVAPEPDTPDLWHQELVRGLETGEADLRTWWTALGDPVLERLIDRATEGSLELEEALGRVLEARAFLGIAAGELAPAIDGVGSIERNRQSENIVPDPIAFGDRTDTIYTTALDSSWELDVWGRIRRSVESADASLQASVEDYRDVLVSLYADVASSYTDVRSLQARVRFAEGNAETQRGSLRLTIDRRDAGIGSDLEVAQAEQNLARTEAFIPSLRIALAAAIHRLGVLIGEHPAALYAELEPEAAVPAPPPRVLVGLPADMLRRRPDVRRAERELAAQTARIGVATAELYPRFSLNGFFGFDSLIAGEAWQRASGVMAFGPSFRWNLFDGGRVRSAIRVEDARTEQALARYERAVLEALEDVENATVGFVEESERRDALGRAVTASRKAVELVDTLYRTGLTDFQNVLDTERTLFEQEDAFAESEGLVARNLIAIYRSVGGGWAP